eukprot:678024-Rhodomonas_salina.1
MRMMPVVTGLFCGSAEVGEGDVYAQCDSTQSEYQATALARVATQLTSAPGRGYRDKISCGHGVTVTGNIATQRP